MSHDSSYCNVTALTNSSTPAAQSYATLWKPCWVDPDSLRSHSETTSRELTAALLVAIFKTNGNKLRMTCRVMLPHKSNVALKFHIQCLIG